MDTKSSTPQDEIKQQEEQKAEKPEWYTFLIDIFKKLLEINYSTYGAKKKF